MYICSGKEWNETKSTCKGQTRPLGGSVYPGGAMPAVEVVREVLSNMMTEVTLLDVTTLSQLRPDGHPSLFGNKPKKNDCSHWCLAGTPDTWNQIMYAILVSGDTLKV